MYLFFSAQEGDDKRDKISEKPKAESPSKSTKEIDGKTPDEKSKLPEGGDSVDQTSNAKDSTVAPKAVTPTVKVTTVQKSSSDAAVPTSAPEVSTTPIPKISTTAAPATSEVRTTAATGAVTSTEKTSDKKTSPKATTAPTTTAKGKSIFSLLHRYYIVLVYLR